jgi:hypothetical protein
VCWLFPSKTIRIDAPCLDCAEPMVVEMRDGALLRADPPTIVGHLNQPWGTGATPEERAFR